MDNFNEATKRAEAEYGFGGSSGANDWFKLVEGDNRIRIMSWLEPLGNHFSKNPANYSGICIGKENCLGCKQAESEPDEKKKNKVQVKFLCWVLDLKDNKLKLAKFAYKVMQQLQAYQTNPEWQFNEMPMPYNVNINAKGAGTTTVVYTVMPTPIKPISEEILALHAKNNSPVEIKERMKEKKLKELGITPTGKKETDIKGNYPTPEEEGIDPGADNF